MEGPGQLQLLVVPDCELSEDMVSPIRTPRSSTPAEALWQPHVHEATEDIWKATGVSEITNIVVLCS